MYVKYEGIIFNYCKFCNMYVHIVPCQHVQDMYHVGR